MNFRNLKYEIIYLKEDYLATHLCTGVGVQGRGGGAAPVDARGTLRARGQQRVESFALQCACSSVQRKIEMSNSGPCLGSLASNTN